LRPFVDTESGVAATTPAQESVQARTVVQKMVHAQSQGLPLLMFFRLYMTEEPYGMLYGEREPRQSVVAYAAMTRTLRGHSFERELSGLPAGMAGYVLARADQTGRVAVLWQQSPSPRTAYLRLGEGGAGAVERVDLFGNRAPVTPDDSGVLAVEVGQDPLYLRWAGAERADAGAAGVPRERGGRRAGRTAATEHSLSLRGRRRSVARRRAGAARGPRPASRHVRPRPDAPPQSALRDELAQQPVGRLVADAELGRDRAGGEEPVARSVQAVAQAGQELLPHQADPLAAGARHWR